MKQDIYEKLKEIKPILKERFGIEEFAVFGSFAKGKEHDGSDIDIAILKMNLKSGYGMIQAQYYLESVLERNIDIGNFKSMKTFIRNRIKKDFVYV